MWSDAEILSVKVDDHLLLFFRKLNILFTLVGTNLDGSVFSSLCYAQTPRELYWCYVIALSVIDVYKYK
jgi:hypothetical protein